jgi:hypothetical protein
MISVGRPFLMRARARRPDPHRAQTPLVSQRPPILGPNGAGNAVDPIRPSSPTRRATLPSDLPWAEPRPSRSPVRKADPKDVRWDYTPLWSLSLK